MVDLEDGRSFAVRPSGTEPKIKYYLFSQNPTGGKTLSSDEIASLKDDSASKLKSLWNYLEKDIQVRLSA